jgi:hypothetical protein
MASHRVGVTFTDVSSDLMRVRQSFNPGPSPSLSIAKDALEGLVRRLSALSGSGRVRLLTERAKRELAEVDAWKLSPPGSERRDALMRRILQLHFDIVSLEHDSVTR